MLTPKDVLNIITSQEELEPLKWREQIPFFSLPDDMEIKVSPNFLGSVVRFIIRSKTTQKQTSVYLDCYNLISFRNAPYWEIYPDKNEFTSVFDIKDVNRLMEAIKEALK